MNTTPTTADGNAIRARFEAWARKEGFGLSVFEDENYDETRTFLAWRVWQAALSPR